MIALLCALLAIVDDRPCTGFERATTPPNVLTIGVRTLFLEKGMTEKQVELALGLEDSLLGTGGGTLSWWAMSYPVRPDHNLLLLYKRDSKRDDMVLDEVRLQMRVSQDAPQRRND